MLTFFITTEERRRAQYRAAELDISKSKPPGQYPFVWDNRQNCVKRWYDYGSAQDKVGAVHFDVVSDHNGRLPTSVRCTTEITRHPLLPERQLCPVAIADPEEHKKLMKLFLRELLDARPHVNEATPLP